MADVYETTARVIITDGPLVLAAGKHTEAFWILPGGHWDAGETVLETVRRECYEELGSPLSLVRKLTVLPNTWPRQGDTVHEIMHLYAGMARAVPHQCLPQGPERGTRLQWVTVDDLYAGRMNLQPLAVWPWIVHAAGR